jgi:UDP-N-acetylglucosamine 3-dehydrogenase
MSKKKQTALIGAGSFGRAHARNYNDISDLVAICDTNLESAKNAALDYEDVRVYNDLDKMLKEEKIDSLSIVTPPSAIPSLTKKCAEKGINVLMEKPMGLKYEDVEALSSMDTVRIQPGFIELYNPVVDEAKKYLPRIGNLLTISSKRVGLFPRRYWGMGVVLDLTVHDVYLQREFLGDVKSVKSMVRYFHDDQYEDAAYVLLNFGEAKGLIESNWITPTKYRKMFLSGEKGTIEVDFVDKYIKFLEGKDLTKAKPEIWETKINYLRSKEPLREELMDFLYSDKPKVTLKEHGLKALKVVLDVLQEAKKK